MTAHPSISVNKLAEYINSKGARQRKILTDRKHPDPEFSIGMYHKEASEAVASYIAGGCIDATSLNQRLAILSQLKPEKIGTARRINGNIDALERFSEMLDMINLMGADPELGAVSPPKLTFHNVQISVRPEIILRGVGPKGKSCVGGLKFHFSRTHPHDDDSAGYVSAVVQEWCRVHLAGENDLVHPAYCQVIDVASGKVFPRVKATTQRMKDVASECQNIAAIWPSI